MTKPKVGQENGFPAIQTTRRHLPTILHRRQTRGRENGEITVQPVNRYLIKTLINNLRFPHDPSKAEADHNVIAPAKSNFENDRIMGIPNKDCDDGEVSVKFTSEIYCVDTQFPLISSRQISAPISIQLVSITPCIISASSSLTLTRTLNRFLPSMTCPVSTRPCTSAWTSP